MTSLRVSPQLHFPLRLVFVRRGLKVSGTLVNPPVLRPELHQGAFCLGGMTQNETQNHGCRLARPCKLRAPKARSGRRQPSTATRGKGSPYVGGGFESAICTLLTTKRKTHTYMCLQLFVGSPPSKHCHIQADLKGGRWGPCLSTQIH